MIDAYARRIVGCKVSTSATAGVVFDAMEQAIHARRLGPDDGLIHRSDRGVQYLALDYTQRLAEANYRAANETLLNGGIFPLKLPPENPGRFRP